ncbi:MAG TPA: hypothetical protein VGP47_11105 [Parachlamydiaceae bacterium]|nr:hypothetical protein [Parachlamydiaceae bacterium]
MITGNFFNNFNPYDYYNMDSSSEDEDYINVSRSIDSDDFTEISIESESASEITSNSSSANDQFSISSSDTGIEIEETDSFSWGSDDSTSQKDSYNSQGDGYDSDEVELLRKLASSYFYDFQNTYKTIFQHPGIQPLDQNKKYPTNMTDLEIDVMVVKSVNEVSHLMTSRVGVCLVVMARGWNPQENGQYMAFIHSSADHANEVLTDIREELVRNGCSRKSIEFFIVGGSLPLKDGGGFSHSLDRQKEFLTLSKEFNIVGARLNIVENEGESLRVIMSSDEIVWLREQAVKWY